jgi:hypothetical protein
MMIVAPVVPADSHVGTRRQIAVVVVPVVLILVHLRRLLAILFSYTSVDSLRLLL